LVVKDKARRLCPYGRAKNPTNEKQTNIDPWQESPRCDDVAMINDAPICVDDDLRKTLRQCLCANLMCGDRLPVHETRFGKDKRARAQGNQHRACGMAIADPRDNAGGNIGI
jgi:hypothetical protein